MTLASFRLLGVDIRLDGSWIIFALLIAWSLAIGVFPRLHAGLPAFSYWGMAAATVAGVAASIVLHELGHTLAGRLFGVRVRSITLFVFGGVAAMEDEPKTASGELFMALMGPVVSAVLAGAFIASANALKLVLSTETYGVLHYLGMLNAVLALFNMAPAFPLDGGRVLRAVLWMVRGDALQATRIAARVGELIALLLMGLGLVAALSGGVTGGLWWLVLGFYILLMARAHRAQADAKALLSGVRVTDVMTSNPFNAPAAVSVEQFVRDYLSHHPHDLIPVMDRDSVVGGAGFKEVKDLPREKWASTPLSEVMTPLRAIPVATPETDVSQALNRMQSRAASRILVMSGDRLVGILTLKDVLAQLRFRATFPAS
jgi:Zn-dependent protease